MNRSHRTAAVRTTILTLVFLTLGGCDRFSRPTAPPGFRTSVEAPGARDWIVVSDVHFDPFGDPTLAARLADADVSAWPTLLASRAGEPPAPYGSDTNPALWISTLRALHRTAPNAEVALVPGDLLAHDFAGKYRRTLVEHGRGRGQFDAFVVKTSTYLARSLHAALPRAQLLPAIGNNDGSCGDYAIAPRTPYLSEMARVWAPFVNVAGRSPDFIHSFSDGGYYAARTPIPHLRVVVPDSVFWSMRYGDECVPASVDPGNEQLAWLERTLSSHAAGERTWIETHIPPGIDVVYTFLHLGNPVTLLRPEAQARMLAAIDAPHTDVVLMLTGHLHQTGYRRTRDGDGPGAPVLVAPSISPIFGNAPSFLVLSVAPSGMVLDFRAIALHGLVNFRHAAPSWREEYRFARKYHEAGLTMRTLRDLHAREAGSRELRSHLANDAVSGGIVRIFRRLDWRSIWCAETALSKATYVRCAQAGVGVPSSRATPMTSSLP